MLVNRLENHIFGENDVVMDASHIRAAEILLKKTLPDLQATTIAGDPDNDTTIPVEHVFDPELIKQRVSDITKE